MLVIVQHVFYLLLALGCLINFIFFFNDTATTEIYTLSLHDALPISSRKSTPSSSSALVRNRWRNCRRDRKSTRLNSSHGYISYAVFCLKKKKKERSQTGSMSTPNPSWRGCLICNRASRRLTELCRPT